jgi:hypothetical protein
MHLHCGKCSTFMTWKNPGTLLSSNRILRVAGLDLYKIHTHIRINVMCIYVYTYIHTYNFSFRPTEERVGISWLGKRIVTACWGRDFPHPFRPALGPNQPPVQLTQGFPGINRTGRGVDHPPQSITEFNL